MVLRPCRFLLFATRSGGDVWHLVSDGKVLQRYRSSDLRMSFVWRARCFASEEEKAKFSEHSVVSVAEALTKLVADLRARCVCAMLCNHV